jgi:hypothetical protein
MVVHYVEVNPVGTGFDDVGDFGAESGEVGGKDAGGDDEHGDNP